MGPEQLSELLKVTLDREEASNPPPPAAWGQIERRLRREPWRRALIAVASVSVVAAVAVAATQQLGRRDMPGPSWPRPGPLALLSTTRLPHAGVSAAIGYGAVWIAGTGMTYEVDQVTGGLLRTIVTSGTSQTGCPSGVATGFGAVWVTYGCQGVYKIEPGTGHVTMTISVPHAAAFIAAAYGLVWVATRTGELMRLNPGTAMAAGAPIPVGHDLLGSARGATPSIVGIVSGDGALWVDSSTGSVGRVDPATNAVSPLKLGDISAVGGGSAWVVSGSELEHDGLGIFAPVGIVGVLPDTEPASMSVALWRGQAWALSWASMPAIALHVDGIDPDTAAVTGVATLPGSVRPGSALGWASITAGPTGLWVLEASQGLLFHLGMPGR
jgi:hypothetical protein